MLWILLEDCIWESWETKIKLTMDLKITSIAIFCPLSYELYWIKNLWRNTDEFLMILLFSKYNLLLFPELSSTDYYSPCWSEYHLTGWSDLTERKGGL